LNFRVDAPIREGETKSVVLLQNETFTADATYMGLLVNYTAFDGFIDGKPNWFIDKIVVEDDRENRYCEVYLKKATCGTER
jgi:hypothetical protein